jgi:hypothetical protein
MHPNRLNRPGRAGRAPRLALLLCLLALAALTAACPEPNNNQGVTTDGTPEPTTGADDRPIIITGGSLNVYFSHQAYAAVGSSGTQPEKFRLNGYRLASMRAYNDDGSENSTVICEPTLGDNTSVNVTYSAGGPSSSPTGSPTGSPSPGASPTGTPATRQLTVTSGVGADGAGFVEVTVDTSANSLPKRPSTRDMHYNRSGRLESLTYGPSGSSPTSCALPANRKATIEINVAPAPAKRR